MNSNFNIWRRIGGGYIVSEATLRKFARLIETFSGNDKVFDLEAAPLEVCRSLEKEQIDPWP